MKIQQNSDSEIAIKNAGLSPTNRLVQDIILWNLTKESLDYLWIVKRSIANSISPWIDGFDSLSDTSQKQLLGFLNSYENPAAWKVIKGKSKSLYSWRFDKQALTELFNDLWWNLWYEIWLWGNWKNLLDMTEDWKMNVTTIEKWACWYDINEDRAKSYKNLFSHIYSLSEYFDIHYIELNSKNLEIEKWMILTDPFKMPYDSDECFRIQQEAGIIEEFLRDFLKKDNIWTHVSSESPISSQRRSLSYIIRGTAKLPTFLEVIVGTSRWAVILNYIQTLDNDWIAVSSIDPKYCMKDKI
ncbi:MAG: hypothetical protein ACD_2C00248G0004 [uncultured bacterium (gcode 4)]|uniref:Uncharacterized protein n=1 Tax=uncultured bacterium (gcode 4) TaxID=1234023 RepID=K2FD19_9BACT|nr:MAG: hypothetical protein ACD_2C00248G0004 [uncultured bacterium (gcode 4)]